MEEVDKKVSVLKVDMSRQEPDFFRCYLTGQLYLSSGDYLIASEELKKAYKGIQSVKTDFIWQNVYYNLCGLLATTFDYLGQLEQADSCFAEAMSLDPCGFYIGEFAVFLHRRKRDYEAADR